MKKMIVVILMGLMSFSICACGGEKTPSDNVIANPESESAEQSSKDDTPVMFVGDYLNLDLLGHTEGDNAVVVVDKKSQLDSYCQSINDVLTSEVEMLKTNGTYVVSHKWYRAMDRFATAIHFFEDRCTSDFFLNNIILFIKSSVAYTDHSVITDVRLVEEDGKKKLHVDIMHVVTDGFGGDAPTALTFWLAVPSNLDIDYENDLVVNSQSGYAPYNSASDQSYLKQDYTVRQWGWLPVTQSDN